MFCFCLQHLLKKLEKIMKIMVRKPKKKKKKKKKIVEHPETQQKPTELQ